MDKIIQVAQGFHPNEYKSLSEAITGSLHANNVEKSKSELINGKIVLDYQFNGHLLIISFENGENLSISPGKQAIEWDVVSVRPNGIGEIKEQNIYFEFKNGKKIFWDWKMILDSFVGNQIAISPSDQFLFIFPRGGDEYMFDVLVDNLGNKFLYLSLA